MLRHFAILEHLRPISPLNSTILPPPPLTMLDFMSLELAFFLNNIEKGEGAGSQCKLIFKWNKQNVAISTRFRQLSQLLLSPIVGYNFSNGFRR